MSESVIATYTAALQGEEKAAQNRNKNGFWNYGYWDGDTTDSARASERLLDLLLTKMPTRTGRVLDVAFGKGESTRRLCEIFGAQSVVGINIASDQVEAARRRGVHCDLRVMDAARMDFDTNTFDAVLCIEAAFHFRTRMEFLRRAHDVLRPGGRLIMSDLLLRSGHGLKPELFPPENQVASLEQYRALFTEIGFAPELVRIERTTQHQLLPYIVNLAHAMRILPFPPEGMSQNVSAGDLWRVWFVVTRLLNVADCVVVVAEKG